MFKKIMYVFLISVSILLSATATVSAARRETLPILMYYIPEGYPYVDCIIQLKSFSVDKVYAISASRNRIEFTMSCIWDERDRYKYIKFYCYDYSGYLIEEHMYQKGQPQVLAVSNRTATIEIIAPNPLSYSESFLYRKDVTVYAKDGRTKEITDLMVPSYEAGGWYAEPFCYMYSLDNKTEIVAKSKVEDYKKAGWYEEPVTMMYSPDNRKKVVLQSKVEANMKVGWYTTPVTTMYSADGRTTVVPTAEVENYKNAGWYISPVYDLAPQEVFTFLQVKFVLC